MKIRITGKGLPKAQWQNSIVNGQMATWLTTPQSIISVNRNNMSNGEEEQMLIDDSFGYQIGALSATGIGPMNNEKPISINKSNKFQKAMGAMRGINQSMNHMMNIAGPIVGFIDQQKRNREIERNYQDSLFGLGPINFTKNRGDYEFNTGMVDPYNTGAKSKGQFTSPFYLPMAADGLSLGPISYGDTPVQRNVFQYSADPVIPQMPAPSSGSSMPVSRRTPSSSSFRDLIAAKESGGNYKALPKDKNGKLVSSAAGKYQFLWEQHKNWITKITGVNSKQEFLNNPDAQEMAFDYWDATVLTPTAEKIKKELGVGDSIEQIKTKVHFAGPGGAYNYYAHGTETKDAFGTTTSTYQEGGATANNMKIRITQVPVENMAYGGQLGYGFDLGGRRVYTDMPESEQDTVANTIGAVDRSQANIEAEGGETILGDMDNDGMMEHMKITGKRHFEGGVPLYAPDGSFIYSDTRKMKIKDPEILKLFGKSMKKGGYTPAEISRNYGLNKYKAMLDDKNADPIAKKTAEMMLDNYQKKLGMLALVQEGMKGFPQGIPSVAESVMPEAKFGGYLRKAAPGTIVDATDDRSVSPAVQQQLEKRYPWLKPWVKANTKKGSTSPTGRTTTYNDNVDNIYKDIEEWEKVAGRQFNSLEDMQGFIYASLEQDDPTAIQEMWTNWGHTAKNKDADIGNFVDNIMGARTAAILKKRLKPKPVPVTPAAPPAAPAPVVPPAFKPKPVEPGNFDAKGPNIPYDWTQQDRNNFMNSLINRANIRKYPSVRRDINPVMTDFRNMDWRGKAAELQGMYNSQLNTMGTYGPAQGFAANASFMAGQQAENLVNRAIEPTEQQNVQIYNQVAAQNAGIMNEALVNSANNTFLRSQDRAVLNQNYDNAVRDANKAVVQTLNQGITNASGIYNTNLVESPYYYYDPRTLKMQFNSPNAYAAAINAIYNATPNDGDPVEKYLKVRNSLTGVPEDRKDEIAGKILGLGISGGSRSTTTYPYNPKNNKNTVQTNLPAGYGYDPQNPYLMGQ